MRWDLGYFCPVGDDTPRFSPCAYECERPDLNRRWPEPADPKSASVPSWDTLACKRRHASNLNPYGHRGDAWSGARLRKQRSRRGRRRGSRGERRSVRTASAIGRSLALDSGARWDRGHGGLGRHALGAAGRFASCKVGTTRYLGAAGGPFLKMRPWGSRAGIPTVAQGLSGGTGRRGRAGPPRGAGRARGRAEREGAVREVRVRERRGSGFGGGSVGRCGRFGREA